MIWRAAARAAIALTRNPAAAWTAAAGARAAAAATIRGALRLMVRGAMAARVLLAGPPALPKSLRRATDSESGMTGNCHPTDPSGSGSRRRCQRAIERGPGAHAREGESSPTSYCRHTPRVEPEAAGPGDRRLLSTSLSRYL
jgi:hypothetical protein